VPRKRGARVHDEALELVDVRRAPAGRRPRRPRRGARAGRGRGRRLGAGRRRRRRSVRGAGAGAGLGGRRRGRGGLLLCQALHGVRVHVQLQREFEPALAPLVGKPNLAPYLV